MARGSGRTPQERPNRGAGRYLTQLHKKHIEDFNRTTNQVSLPLTAYNFPADNIGMRLFRKLIPVLLITPLLFGFGRPQADELERRVLQSALNTALRDIFSGTLKIQGTHLSRNLRLRLSGLSGELVTQERPVRIELPGLESDDPLYYFLIFKPVHFHFSGLKPSGNDSSGISGKAIAVAGLKWTFEITSRIENFGLEEIAWVNPDSLSGSSGRMTGDLKLKADFSGHSEFNLHLDVPEPGGNLQARFFETITPYLPQTKNLKVLRDLSQSHELVQYHQASLDARLEQDDQVKVLLRILIPDYNLNLNLNMLVRVDEKNTFLKLFQLLGILRSHLPPRK